MFEWIFKILGIALIALLVWLAFGTLVVPILMRRTRRMHQWLKDHPMERFYGEADDTGRTEPGPDEAAVMANREDALALRLELLAMAEKKVDILYFQLTKDRSGDIILGQMLDIANHGIQVRCVIDTTGTGYRLKNKAIAWALAAHPNVEFRLFGQVSIARPWIVHNLLHEKMFIIDDEVVMVSGRNIVDRFLTPGYPERSSVEDFDLVVRSDDPKSYRSVLPQAIQHFDDCWNAGQTRLAVRVMTRYRRKKGEELIEELIRRARRLTSMHTSYFGVETVFERLVWRPTARVSLLANNVNEIYKTPRLWGEIARLMNHAKEQISFLSPYFVPVRSMRKLLDDEHLKQLDIRFLTNSMGSTPNVIAFSGYVNRRQFLLDQGRTIYEYQHPGSIHAKVIVFDHRLSMLGSFNCDARSTYLSCEVMLVLDSPELAQDLEEHIAHYQTYSSLKVKPDGSYEESDFVIERKPSRRKRFNFVLFRGLAYLIDYLL